MKNLLRLIELHTVYVENKAHWSTVRSNNKVYSGSIKLVGVRGEYYSTFYLVRMVYFNHVVLQSVLCYMKLV